MTDVLTAIDDALETGLAAHHDPELRDLQELGLLLRADAPEAASEFRARLDQRVENGFAKPRKPRPLQSRWSRMGGPALAASLIVLPLVLLVILAGGSGTSTDEDGGGGGGGSVAASGGGGGGAGETAGPEPIDPNAAAKSGGSADRALARSAPGVALPPSGRGFAPGRSDRKIERSIALELEMPVDEMARVAEQVTTVTNRHGGFVLSSSVSTGEDSAGGDFDLRIPATRLRPALRDLAALADVRTQSQTGRDVTREHVTARDRLRAARAERRSLLRRLEVATTDEEAEAIRRRLDLVAGEINGLRGQLRNLRLRTDYAVVTVSLLPKDGSEGGGVGGGSFDDAIGDAGDILVVVAGVIVRVLAVALPLGLIALVGWLGARVVRRRQRESALA
jgi:Domain of unknown function (DUF4349)